MANDSRINTVDPEELAVRCGIKPVMRATMLREDVPAFEKRIAQNGLVLCESQYDLQLDNNDKCRWVAVYAAQSMEHARSAQAAENEILSGKQEKNDAVYSAALGIALGYPRCCVEAFVASSKRYQIAGSITPLPRFVEKNLWRIGAWLRRRRGPTARLSTFETAMVVKSAEDYLFAHDNWSETPDARLNHLTFRLRARLISHTPCSYHCAPSIAYANRVAAEIKKVLPTALEDIRGVVARPILIAPNMARVHVEMAGERIVRAEPLIAPDLPRGHEDSLTLDHELARMAVGCKVESFGQVWLPGQFPPAILLRFVWPED